MDEKIIDKINEIESLVNANKILSDTELKFIQEDLRLLEGAINKCNEIHSYHTNRMNDLESLIHTLYDIVYAMIIFIVGSGIIFILNMRF